MNGIRLRGLLAAIAATVVTGVLAAPASAGILTVSARDCGNESLSQPFAPFGDRASYKLVAGGDFEDGAAGWTLRGRAEVVRGNEPWKVGGPDHGASLALPAGSSAISPAACVGLAEPTMRFFARKTRAPLLGVSALAVSVYVQTSLGVTVPVPIGVVHGNGRWEPTPPLLIVANLLPLLPGDRTPVAFRFTPILGDWQIDDVYVDPFRYK